MTNPIAQKRSSPSGRAFDISDDPATFLLTDTIANLAAIDTTDLLDGTVASLLVPMDEFELDTNPSASVLAATDGITIVQPTVGITTYRWLRRGIFALAYSYEASWFLDATSGVDTNTGTTAAAPLKTYTELCRRLCPNGQKRIIATNVTVTVAAGTPTGVLRLNLAATSFQNFFILGTVSQGSQITLSAVTNPVPTTNTRGQITTLSGSFAQNDRIRCVSGSQVDALAYCTGVNANAQNVFVSKFFQALTGSAVNLTTGDVVVVETLSSGIGDCDITVDHCVFRLRDLVISGNPSIKHEGSFQLVTYQRCDFSAPNWCTGGEVVLSGCRITSGLWRVGLWIFTGCYFQGNAVSYSFLRDTSVTLNTFNTASQCGFSFFGNVSMSNFEFENGTAISAVTVNGGSFMLQGGTTLPLWGNNAATPYTSGITIVDGGVHVYDAIPTFSATNQARIGSATNDVFTFAQLPIALPGAPASITKANQVGPDGKAIYLTAQQAAIGATNLFAATPKIGSYRIDYYLTCTVAGTGGTATLQITSTDDLGAVTQSATALSMAATGRTSGSFVVETTGAANVTYAIVFAAVTGTPTYTLRLSATPITAIGN